MRYYFITKKEAIDLARDECVTLVKTYDKDAKITVKNRLIIAESNTNLGRVWERASMLRYAGKDLKNFHELNIKSFACRVINLKDKKVDNIVYINRLVNEIRELTDAKVSLSKPDAVFGIVVDNEEYYCILLDKKCKKLQKIYEHPAQLTDKLAVLMINLSGVKESEILLDPCCGTGTIVMYASYMKIDTIGCDISMKMCRYAKTNLTINNLYATIINSDSTNSPIKKGDVMVSNMPYGRASFTYNRDCKKLIEDIIDRYDAKKVIMCKKGDEPEYLRAYDLYVHSNLSRRIIICR